MKNKLKSHVLFLLLNLLALQYIYAQESSCPAANGYTLDQYNTEIYNRFNRFTDGVYNEWLTWNKSTNKGEFNSAKLNTEILNGISNSDPENGGRPNYVILDDRNFYTNGNTGNSAGPYCKWPYIDANNLNNDPNPDNPMEIEGIKYILLTPGDYRDYMTFNPRKSATSADTDTNRKYLLYYPGSITDNDLNTIRMKLQQQKPAIEQEERERVIIENFKLGVPDGPRTDMWPWVIKGLTIRGNRNSRFDDESFILGTGSSTSIISSDNNIIESCLFENQVVGNYINIANGSSNIIHKCVIRDQNDCMITYLAGNDIIGINISTNTSADSEANNNVILNNEIYNVTDAIQLYKHTSSSVVGDMSGTLIYDNDMYNTKMYTDRCGEERMNGEGAIDIKKGTSSNSRTDKIIIANNLFYGWRRSGTEGIGRDFEGRTKDGVNLYTHPDEGDCWHDQNGRGGGSGDAINCHRNAKNIAILYNRVSDCSNGFLIGGGSLSGEAVENIEIYNNTICSLYPSHEDYKGDDDNGSYWTNTIYSEDNQNQWYQQGQGICYEVPLDWDCDNSHQDNYYQIGHGIGEGMRISIPSCRISGNSIKTAIYGMRLTGLGQRAVVTGNHIRDIYRENFYPADGCSFAHFEENTYYDFTSVCWGDCGCNPPSNSVIQNNSFFTCNGCQMGIPFNCSEETNCN